MPESNKTKAKETRRDQKAKKKKTTWMIISVVVLAAVVVYGLFQIGGEETVEAEAAPMQTATVRQNDLLVSASGSGTLIAPSELNLVFRSSGQITSLLVSVGDQVEEGQLLATLDNTLAQISLIEAERNYSEMVSEAAILGAEEAVYAAEESKDDTWDTLGYLISRSVLTWEERTAAAEEALATAEAEGNEESILEAQNDLVYAQKSLTSSQYYYKNEYVPTVFETEVCEGEGRDRTCTTEIWPPSEASINEARTALAIAEINLNAANEYLEAIKLGEIPAGAGGSNIVKLESAILNLQKAQYNFDATMLYAPFSGTVLAVGGQVGENASGSVVTIADLSQYYLEVYLDETDWDKIDLDYEVEVIFDTYPDDVFSGFITEIDPKLLTEQNVSVVRAIVQLELTSDQLDHSFVIGSNAAIEVIAGRADNVLVIPVEALRDLGDGDYMVFLVDEAGDLTPRPVEVGLIDITFVEIISGLERGDVVSTGIVEVE
ncbi:MAG: HlyD family efflux transporter periplasmic adaptor subunit [Chloroflexota bacterium]